MTVTVNGVTFSDVFSFGYCNCELAMVFKKGHKYSSMEDIVDKLAEAGIPVGNFYFKGVSMWDYESALELMKTQGVCSFDEDGETSLLCMIPENIRDNFQIDCRP